LNRLQPGLKAELHCQLYQSWSGGAGDLAEIRAADIPVYRRRAVELRMIPHVERLYAELQRAHLAEAHTLRQR